MPYRDREKRNAYARDWYAKNGGAHKQRVADWNARQRELLRDYVIAAKNHPCTDCGQRFHHVVMDFDHLRDKITNIARLVRTACSLERLKAEIAKCELVCSNCHRLRTWSRRPIT